MTSQEVAENVTLVKVTTRNFQFLLIIAAPLKKGGSDTSAYVVKIFASVWQCVHLFWKRVKETAG